MKIRVIGSDDLRRCPITSLEREHYRDDGTCKCFDVTHCPVCGVKYSDTWEDPEGNDY